MNQPIDFVMMWVDGADPVWLADKSRYDTAGGDNRDVRYRDWDILHYWFRGVEKFAPWVNRVHFITYGHLPAFLNVDHPKLHIVRHEDYIDKKYLPVFSGRPLEVSMHRIPGLSEQFVFFNDDMFLMRPVTPETFFRGGLPCDMAIEMPLYCKEPMRACAQANNLCAVNRHFNGRACRKKHFTKFYTPVYGARGMLNLMLAPWRTFSGFRDFHTPNAYLKSTFEAVWRAEPQILETTCSHRFRQLGDVTQALFKYWQFAEGNFVPVRKHCTEVLAGDVPDKVARGIAGGKYDYVCFNDSDAIEDLEKVKADTKKLFDTILGEKSSFEK